MESTNRKWQKHLQSKGLIPFFLDRLSSHALSSAWQHEQGPFHFPVSERELDDELTRAFFEMTEDFPYEFYIEATSYCNLDCIMCTHGQLERPLGSMRQELFEKVIDEIAVKQPYAHIHYYFMGDPLMDKELFEKLAYAKAQGLRNSVVFTNGQLLLKNDNYIKLAESDVALIGVDLDGFQPQTYEQIRVGGIFERAKEGIEKLYAYIRANNLRPRVEIAYQVYSGINEQDIQPFVDWCAANDYEYKLVTLHTWGGVREDIPNTEVEGLLKSHRGERTNPCSALWQAFVITWDGKVALCFMDSDLREQLGDLTTQSIEEVWKGEHLRKRREHVRGEFTGNCATCSSKTEIKLPSFGSRLYPESLR